MTTRVVGEAPERSDFSGSQSFQNATVAAGASSVPDEVAPGNGVRQKALWILNAWLVFHLFAIVICPASAEPSSPLVQSCFAFVSPYLHALYLDHGFRYFGPEPGPSTLVGYSLEFPDGTTKSGRFPSRAIQPRLFYHRYFMLSEFLGNGTDEELPLIKRAFARNLCRETGAIRVSLTQLVHDTASMEDIKQGLSLNDPSLFKETSIGTYTAEELKSPYDPEKNDSTVEPGHEEAATEHPKDLP